MGRYKEGDEAALENRSSRAQRSPRRLARGAGGHQGGLASYAHKFANHSSCHFSTSVTKELRRLVLNKVSRLKPGLVVVRYQHSRPGEIIPTSKKLGCIAVVGHRITGEHSPRKRGAGWET